MWEARSLRERRKRREGYPWLGTSGEKDAHEKRKGGRPQEPPPSSATANDVDVGIRLLRFSQTEVLSLGQRLVLVGSP